MIKYFRLAWLLTAVLTIGCKDSMEKDWGNGNMDGLASVTNSILKLESESAILPAKGGICQIGYQIEKPSELGFVAASTEAEWIYDLSVVDGAISFRFNDNDVFDTNREATITVVYRSDKETGPSKTIAITQLSNEKPEPELTVNTTLVKSGYTGGEFSADYELSWPVEGVELTATTEDEWITDVTIGETAVSFTVTENKTLEVRNGIVKVAYAALIKEIPVKQDAAPTPVLTVDLTPIEFTEDGGSGEIAYSIENPLEILTLEVTANVTWITDITIGETSVTFNVPFNEDPEELAGEITFKYNNVEKAVSVTQGAASANPFVRTAFSAEGWAWKAGDIVSMQLESATEPGTYDLWKFSAREDGANSKLDIVDADIWATIADNWKLGDYAFFPKATPGYINYFKTNNTIQLTGTIGVNTDDPKRVMPFIGKKDSETNTYIFHPAAGLIKVTISNIPADAAYAALEYDDNATYALNGTFTYGEDCEIKDANCTGTKYGQKYINFTAPASGTMEFYFPIPTGTLPAGLKLTVYNASVNKVYGTRATEEAIAVVAGETVVLPDFELPAYDWTSIGKVWFSDNYIYGQNSFNKRGRAVQVDAEQSISNPNIYRLANPYGTAASKFSVTLPGETDQYFVFTVDGETVSFDNHKIGLTFTGGSYTDCNIMAKDASSANSKVVLDGATPKMICLSPLYVIESVGGNGEYTVNLSDRSAYTNIVNIVMPGYSVAELVSGRWDVNGNANYYIEIEPNDGEQNVVITRYVNQGNLDITGTCYGTYDQEAGTLVFPNLQKFANTGDTWTGATHTGSEIWWSFRNYLSGSTADVSLEMNNINGYWYNDGKFGLDKYVVDYGDASGYTTSGQNFNNPNFIRH